MYCCGPLGGNGYPDYAGPLFGNLSLYCFRCGRSNPEHIIASKNANLQNNILGCCEKHIDLINADFEIRPAGTERKRKVRIAGHVIEL